MRSFQVHHSLPGGNGGGRSHGGHRRCIIGEDKYDPYIFPFIAHHSNLCSDKCFEGCNYGIFRLAYGGFHFRSLHRNMLPTVADKVLQWKDCDGGYSSRDHIMLCQTYPGLLCNRALRHNWSRAMGMHLNSSIPHFFYVESVRVNWQYLDHVLPIALILLFNGLTVRHIIAANRVSQSLRNNSENQKVPEVENRRKSMVLLFALSANFILLWMPYVVSSVNWQIQNYFYTDRYLSNPTYILQQLGFMFKFLSTCTNTCIYILSQRKIREELMNGGKFVLTLNGHCCK